jgi:hypothetical protein
MRVALAEKLLVKIMGWTTDEVTRERPLLQAMANFKYDEYQQFSPGIRFIESLVLWLRQFETIQERKVAYNFFKKHLTFISNAEMFHLVSLAFPDVINITLLKKTALQIPCSEFQIAKIANSPQYQKALDQSLFIGLSDGSRIDQFRRVSRINNEQVSSTYHISKAKAEDMLKELKQRLRSNEVDSPKFNSLFLLDDFTASGVSYFMPADKKGKIYKCLSALFEREEDGEVKENYLGSLVDFSDIEIHIIFYAATDYSLDNLKNKIREWFHEKSLTVKFSINAMQIINSNIKDEVISDTQMIDLAKKYFDSSIVDRHYMKGKHDEPYLGFNECSLPLILGHNTPNNSLPILWFPEDKDYRGLFPRISRHR